MAWNDRHHVGSAPTKALPTPPKEFSARHGGSVKPRVDSSPPASMTAPISVHSGGATTGQAARHAPISAATAAKPPRDLARAFASIKNIGATDDNDYIHARIPVADKPVRSASRQQVASTGVRTGRASRQTTREVTGARQQTSNCASVAASGKCDMAAAPKMDAPHGSDLNCSNSSSHTSRSSKDDDNDEFESELKLERQRERQLRADATTSSSHTLAPAKLEHRLNSSGRSSRNAPHSSSENVAQPLPRQAPSARADAKDASIRGNNKPWIGRERFATAESEEKSASRRQEELQDNGACTSAKHSDDGDGDRSTHHHANDNHDDRCNIGLSLPEEVADRPWVDAPAIGGLGLELTLDVTATPHSSEHGNDRFGNGGDNPVEGEDSYGAMHKGGLEIRAAAGGGSNRNGGRKGCNGGNIGRACLGSAQYDLSASGTLTVDAFQIRREGTQRYVQPPPPLPPHAQPSHSHQPLMEQQQSTVASAKHETRALVDPCPQEAAPVETSTTVVAKTTVSSSSIPSSSNVAHLPGSHSLASMASGALCDELVGLGMLGAGASSTVSKALHVPSLRLVARKDVPVFDDSKRKQMVRELRALYLNLVPLHAHQQPSRSQESVVAEQEGKGARRELGDRRRRRREGSSSGDEGKEEKTEDQTHSRGAKVGGVIGDSATSNNNHINNSEGSGGGGSGKAASCECMVSFYDAFLDSDAGCCAIVMEYMDGGSLQDIVDSGGCSDLAVVANVAFRCLHGLKFLHDRKQIHRDIKPANLLINHHGQVKVSDFGIAREMHTSTGAPRGLESSKSNGLLENVNDTGDNNDDALGESSLGHSVCESSCQSMADTFVGTYTYMSPERIGGLPYGYAADVWSLGLSLLTLILGVFPYESAAQIKGYWGLLHDITTLPSPELPPNDHESDRMGDDNESTEAAGHHQTQPIGSKSRSRKGCYYPPELRDFLAKCLAKDPSQRPSVRDLLQHPLVRGCTLEDGDNNKASARGLEGEQEDKHDVGGSSGSSNSVSDGNGGSGINLESETALLELDHVCHGLRSYYRNKWAKQASEGQLPDVPNFQRDRVASLAQQVGVLEATARLKFAALAHTLRQDAAAIFSEEKPADSCDGCE